MNHDGRISSREHYDADLFMEELLGKTEPITGVEDSTGWELEDELEPSGSEQFGDGLVARGTGSRGAKLSVSRQGALFRNLLRFRPSASLRETLDSRGVRLQSLDDGRGRVQLDYFGVLIDRLPNRDDESTRFTPHGLVEHIRTNLDDFLDSEVATIVPLTDEDRNTWGSSEPVGAVLRVDLRGPDDGAVVCSRRRRTGRDGSHWMFSTVRTADQGRHPLSGNRKIGIFRNAKGKLVLYTKGAHRLATLRSAVASPLAFRESSALWASFQQRVHDFVRDNDGKAKRGLTTSQLYKWANVRAL